MSVSQAGRVFPGDLDLFLNSDVRPALESIQAPTLLLHRRGDRHVHGDHAKDLAERIPHARLVEFDGDDHIWFAGDADRVLDEIESFLTGGRPAAPSNRVLSTVLFTDIVGSTQRAAQLGDDAWSSALAAPQPRRRAARGRLTGRTRQVHRRRRAGDLRRSGASDQLRVRDPRRGGGPRLVDSRGMHTGEVEMADGDVHGIAVHIAARIMGSQRLAKSSCRARSRRWCLGPDRVRRSRQSRTQGRARLLARSRGELTRRSLSQRLGVPSWRDVLRLARPGPRVSRELDFEGHVFGLPRRGWIGPRGGAGDPIDAGAVEGGLGLADIATGDAVEAVDVLEVDRVDDRRLTTQL